MFFFIHVQVLCRWVQIFKIILLDVADTLHVTTWDLTGGLNRSLIFTSPGYPEGYAPNIDYSWVFTGPPGFHFGLSFYTIDIEESRNCAYDSITIYDGNIEEKYDTSNVISKVCTSNATRTYFVSTKPVMSVKFITDYYNNGTGFRAWIFRGLSLFLKT